MDLRRLATDSYFRTLDALAAAGDLLVDREVAERMGRIKLERNEFGVDPFGFDADFAARLASSAVWLYRHYFRTEATGLEHLPPGRCFLIANHSGQIPLDAVNIVLACLLQAEPPRMVRSMIERWVPSLPFVSFAFNRAGQVLGSPENCRRVLAAEQPILIFPEGMRGITKVYSQRYQLQPFGFGFMRLALETKTPIVPVAVVGAEEQLPALYNARGLARFLGLPALPIAFPLPLPVKYRIAFGEPMLFSGDSDEDDEEVGRKVKQVRQTISRMLEEGLAKRQHVFW